MKSNRPVPTFYKGDLVRPVGTAHAWRRATAEEQGRWYTAMKENRENPLGDDGEFRLAPREIAYTLRPDNILTVVRGRARPTYGYHSVSDCCEVFCPDNGQTLFVKRDELTNRW